MAGEFRVFWHHQNAAEQTLEIESAVSGSYNDSMPGENEEGWDAVDNKMVINNGNYGVMYNLSVQVKNSTHHPCTGSLYLNPAGAYGHFALLWNKQFFQSVWYERVLGLCY